MAVPPAVVTLTVPDAPFPGIADILVDELIINEEAGTPPNCTDVAPVKLLPVMVTVAPVAAVTGVKDVMTGVGTKLKPLSVAVPPGVVTATVPEAAAFATTAVIVVEEMTVKELAATPPIFTSVAPERLVPLIVIVSPAPALVGVKELIVGGLKNWKKPL